MFSSVDNIRALLLIDWPLKWNVQPSIHETFSFYYFQLHSRLLDVTRRIWMTKLWRNSRRFVGTNWVKLGKYDVSKLGGFFFISLSFEFFFSFFFTNIVLGQVGKRCEPIAVCREFEPAVKLCFLLLQDFSFFLLILYIHVFSVFFPPLQTAGTGETSFTKRVPWWQEGDKPLVSGVAVVTSCSGK